MYNIWPIVIILILMSIHVCVDGSLENGVSYSLLMEVEAAVFCLLMALMLGN